MSFTIIFLLLYLGIFTDTNPWQWLIILILAVLGRAADSWLDKETHN